MQSARFVALAVGMVSMTFLQTARAQTFNLPVTINANVGGGASLADIVMNMTGNGSGTNGPATAQYGANIACSKNNWKTATTVGEIDCLNIGLHQGGPGSDSSGILVGVQNTGLGNTTDVDMTASNINTATNTNPFMVNVKLGVITSAKQMYGAMISAVDGAGGAALYVNAQGSSSWTTVLQAAKLGAIYFKIDDNGNLLTTGKISTASLTTSGAIHAMAGIVTTVPASFVVDKANCGTTLRSTATSPVTVTVPSGLPLGCHINVIQASDATVTFRSRGIEGEHEGISNPEDFTTRGRFAEAELTIDSTKTFLLRGEVGSAPEERSSSLAIAHPAVESRRVASLQ